MAKFEARRVDEATPAAEYAVPGSSASAVIESRLLTSETSGLWLAVTTLADSARVTIVARPPGAAVFVERGGLRLHDGRECPPDGAVMIGGGQTLDATAVGATRLAHFGGGEPHSGGDVAPEILVIGERARYESGSREGVQARWFGDSSDERCPLTLMHVAQAEADKKGPPHSHSAHEVIYLLEGGVTMGAHRYGAGTALFIPRDVRYALSGGPDGYAFLNFRAEASVQTYARDQPPVEESALARGGTLVDDIR